MRYFTKEQWAGWQEQPPTRDWTALWERNVRSYRRQLARLRPRMSARAHSFFVDHNLHDGRVVKLILDAPKSPRGPRWSTESIELVVESTTSTQLSGYMLRYHNVSRIQLDSPSDRVLFPVLGTILGDWGYDELTAAAPKRLRHEILFASGSALLIEFEKFTWSLRRLPFSSARARK